MKAYINYKYAYEKVSHMMSHEGNSNWQSSEISLQTHKNGYSFKMVQRLNHSHLGAAIVQVNSRAEVSDSKNTNVLTT